MILKETAIILLCFCAAAQVQSKSTRERRQVDDNAPLQPISLVDPLEGDQEETFKFARPTGRPLPFRGLSKNEYSSVCNKVKTLRMKMANKMAPSDAQASQVSGGTLLGDIALTEEQVDQMLAAVDGIAIQSSALVSGFRFRRWPNTIPYVIDTSAFSSQYQVNIREGIKFWQDNTCLTFQDYTGQSTPSTTYMYFQASESGCWSYVGKLSNTGPQPINLESTCASEVSTVIHEIAHALGMFHEQSRPDRDTYVTINTENIPSSVLNNFDKVTSADTLGTAYDYGSVMHYGSTAFSINRQNTISTKDPEYQNTIGQRVTGSFFDILGMNYAYSCLAGACSNLVCQNNGIPNVNGCSSCICPEGYGGTTCATAGLRSSGCTPSEGDITVSSTTENCISTPQWPNRFLNNDVCNWVLKTNSPTNRIKYRFSGSFWMSYGSSDGRCYHWAEIKDNANTTLRGKRFCGASAPTFSGADSDGFRTSAADTIVVSFNGEFGSTLNGIGFKLCYKLVDNGGESATATTASTTTSASDATTSSTSTTTASTTTTTTTAATTTTTVPQSGLCASSPCQNAGTCTQTTSTSYTCSCLPWFTGTNCETRNFCVNRLGLPTCNPQGTDECITGRTVRRRFTCQCKENWGGRFCQFNSDPCYRFNGRPLCNVAGTESCESNGRRFTCNCKQDWSGRLCQRTSNTCYYRSGRPRCVSTGTSQCVQDASYSGGFQCQCLDGFSGRFCQLDANDYCSPNPCQNNGRCRKRYGRYSCRCPRDFFGQNCEFSAREDDPSSDYVAWQNDDDDDFEEY